MTTPCDSNAPELAAAINTAASLMAKGKSIEEIEMLAILFNTLSDTLFAIALIEKKQRRLCEEREKRCKEFCDKYCEGLRGDNPP
jgi:hypothetical protein